MRIGFLTRPSPRAIEMLDPLKDQLEAHGASVERIAYTDDATESIRERLVALDGVLVWINPIQDGATREHVDTLLRDVSTRGPWVSAHPDVIDRMGTKEVLYRTRGLGWGSDVDLYPSVEEFATRFPARVRRATTPVVLKQARGNGGQGVWRVEPVSGDTDRMRVFAAEKRGEPAEEMTLDELIATCAPCFAWSGSMIAQPYLERLREGMIRCYFSQNEVAGFQHQWPRQLLEPDAAAASVPTERRWEHADVPTYAALRAQAEREWVPQMQELLGLSTQRLPVIWDADFLRGPRTAAGQDSYVLCEINISCVWPFPPQAIPAMTRAVLAR